MLASNTVDNTFGGDNEIDTQVCQVTEIWNADEILLGAALNKTEINVRRSSSLRASQ
jgi:hypothetical protein